MTEIKNLNTLDIFVMRYLEYDLPRDISMN
jgi:hypothetical protein